MKDQPRPISATELEERLQRVSTISVDLGFVGSVEYRHVYSQSGGAQYCIGPSADDDIMVVYAEAFERDANPDDFNLDAMIAHECGHQRLHRHPRFRPVVAKFPGEDFEEILASLVGSILLIQAESAQMLRWKAAAELHALGVSVEFAEKFVAQLSETVRRLL